MAVTVISGRRSIPRQRVHHARRLAALLLLALGCWLSSADSAYRRWFSLLTSNSLRGGFLLAGQTVASDSRGRVHAAPVTSLRALATKVVAEKVNSSAYSKSFMTLEVNNAIRLNVTWGCNEERGDKDCQFKVTAPGYLALYSDHAAGGDGWSITSKKFELQSPHRKQFTVAHTIDNPCGDSSGAEAAPQGQISEVFNELLEPTGTTIGDVIEVIEKKIPVKDIKYWPQVQEYW
eukprot:CAMPEP_0172826760 /NCGR_PEP_ID=MMETSP1075-20121228/19642_1 /TAXON_ID=2916 /ORGANISM="Ceratium fusus, Strain PA161109" /LENGTH=233 /DNA_ID=CAMNT_0013668461 /DNA_START=16 /DNA_END=714 /DNA_ORIENTATION=-